MDDPNNNMTSSQKSRGGRQANEPLSPKHCGWNGGPLNRRGLPCRKLHRKGGNGRCRTHGGATPAPGPTHPNYKHGRYSKAFPPRLRDRFNAALNDPDLLSSREAAAVLSTRLVELIAKLDSGENDHLLERIAEAWADFKDAKVRARNAGDDDEVRAKARDDAQAATKELDRLISAGGNDMICWQEIRAVTKEFSSVSSAEHKRLVDLNQMLSIDQVMVLSSALLQMNKDVIERYAAIHNFDGKRALAEIGNGFAKLFNRPGHGEREAERQELQELNAITGEASSTSPSTTSISVNTIVDASEIRPAGDGGGGNASQIVIDAESKEIDQ
jgi:hypothetical protein